VKSYDARIARLERILGPRSQKMALQLFVDLLVQTKNEEERQERARRSHPPKVSPDEGGRPAVCDFQIRPAPPEEVQHPPAYIEYMAAQAARAESPPPPTQPAQPAPSKSRRKTAKKEPPVMDMSPLPAHRQFRGWREESDDEQRRRVPPLVI
jgi:hypothetical protein